MNAQELFLKDGKSAGVYCCAKCKIIGKNRELVEQCCICKFCGKVVEDRKNDFNTSHRNCWHENQSKREFERLEKAELVEDYSGPYYCIQGWGQDGFLFTEEDMIECFAECSETPEDWPEFVHCCTPIKPQRVRADWLIESFCENLYEDSYDDLKGTKELQEACDRFYEANKHLVAYQPDYTRKVRVPPIPEDVLNDFTEG